MNTKAAIWVRVSTDRQHEDNQIPDLERLCEHRGWEVARRYEIAHTSAYKGEHREALARMLEDAHRGEFSVLVVWAVDLLCRQGIEELLRLIRELLRPAGCSELVDLAPQIGLLIEPLA
jgi:DNA invertase Pin-like site-specific DNA recombinase